MEDEKKGLNAHFLFNFIWEKSMPFIYLFIFWWRGGKRFFFLFLLTPHTPDVRWQIRASWSITQRILLLSSSTNGPSESYTSQLWPPPPPSPSSTRGSFQRKEERARESSSFLHSIQPTEEGESVGRWFFLLPWGHMCEKKSKLQVVLHIYNANLVQWTSVIK